MKWGSIVMVVLIAVYLARDRALAQVTPLTAIRQVVAVQAVKHKISKTEARAIAKVRHPGTIQGKAELVQNSFGWEYWVKVKSGDAIYQLIIDAESGIVTSDLVVGRMPPKVKTKKVKPFKVVSFTKRSQGHHVKRRSSRFPLQELQPLQKLQPLQPKQKKQKKQAKQRKQKLQSNVHQHPASSHKKN